MYLNFQFTLRALPIRLIACMRSLLTATIVPCVSLCWVYSVDHDNYNRSRTATAAYGNDRHALHRRVAIL